MNSLQRNFTFLMLTLIGVMVFLITLSTWLGS